MIPQANMILADVGLFRLLGIDATKNFKLFWFSNLLTLKPDEGYSRNTLCTLIKLHIYVIF